MDQLFADLPTRLTALAWSGAGLVVAAVIVFLVYRALASVSRGLVARASASPLAGESDLDREERAVRRAERARRLQTLAGFLLRLVRWIAYLTFLVMTLDVFLPGIWDRLGGLGVGFGAAIGAALGFGAQQLVRDYLNGVLILGENPYSVGDVVSVAEVRGTVEDVNLRRTLVRDMDGTLHSVPNGDIHVASNFTRGFTRVNEQFVVAHGADISRATSLIDRAGAALAAEPPWNGRIVVAPRVLRVEPVTDPGIPILVTATVRPGAQWEVGGELRRRIVEAFDDGGIPLAAGRRPATADGGGSSPGASVATAGDGVEDVEFS